jgi:PPOX class probable F420-dependent enzyme
MIFDANDVRGAHALRRLTDAKIGWLTTVTSTGQPQTLPIWFLWQDGELLVYGDHRARRNANIEANSKVSLHLDSDGNGGDIIVVEGLARIDPDHPAIPDNPAYLAKYGAWIDRDLGGPARMAQTYSMPIRISPTRGISVPG